MTPATEAVQTPAQDARMARMAATYADIRGRYTPDQLAGVKRLYETVRAMRDTGGGRRCAKFLLGLYNGERFPFDLTDLRTLDSELYAAAIKVLHMDARHTYVEVHVLLGAIYADGRNVGGEFEQWAYDMRHGKRCKRDQLPEHVGPIWPSLV